MSELDRLSPRQQDVVECLTKGLSNKEIGSELGLSPGTIKVHVSDCMKKLSLPNRTALAMWYVRNKTT